MLRGRNCLTLLTPYALLTIDLTGNGQLQEPAQVVRIRRGEKPVIEGRDKAKVIQMCGHGSILPYYLEPAKPRL